MHSKANIHLVRRAIFLSWCTIIYNIIEGVISIFFGISDGAISLAGFGGDSLIEVASASFVLWRFKGDTSSAKYVPIERERKATFGIGILFILLAAVTIASALHQLYFQGHPTTTVPGILISSLSLSFMFFLWKAKKNVAIELNSAAISKDADCSMACIKLSTVLLVGSGLYFFAPSFWWADSIAALVIAIFILKEGIETVKASRSENFQGGCGCV